MVRRTALMAVPLALIAGACATEDDPPLAEPTPASTVAPGSCSAASLESDAGEPDNVPASVISTRDDVVRLATACDYEGLETLASGTGEQFNYSFGTEGAEGAGAFWEQAEQGGEEALGILVRLFGLPHGIVGDDPDIYVWPSAHTADATDGDFAAVEAEFGEDWRTGEGYLGPRVGIAADGTWRFYAAGD